MVLRRPLLGMVLAGALVASGLSALGLMNPAERQFYDVRLTRLQRSAGPLPNVILVAIDEESLRFLTWPWPREYQAQLLDKLHGARVVLWDSLLSDPYASVRTDQQLAEAIARHGRVLLAAAADRDQNDRISFPDGRFQSVAAGVGLVRYLPDADGVVRGSDCVLRDDAGHSLPLLSVLFAKAIRPSTAIPDGRVNFNFQGGEAVYEKVSLSQVLLGEVDPTLFRDKYVLVGATAQGINDRIVTPFSTLSGVLYHAHAAASLVRGDYRKPLPAWTAWLGSALMAAATILVWEWRSAVVALGLQVGGISLLAGLDAAVFAWGHTWLPLPTMLLSSVGTLLAWGVGRQIVLAYRLRQATDQLMAAYRRRPGRHRGGMGPLEEGDAGRQSVQEQVNVLLAVTDALYEEWQFLQALIDTNQNPILVCDEDQRVVLCNRAGQALFGNEAETRSLSDLLGATLSDETVAECVAAFQLAADGGEGSGTLLVPWRHAAYRATFLQMAGRRGALCLFEDVTALHRRANTDGLTGLWNRRYFDEQLSRELDRHRRHGDEHPVSLLLMDIDHFKRVNDTYGHQTGDRVLIAIATLLSQLVRGTDLPFRYGGEEIGVLMPHTSLDGASILAERIRSGIEGLTVETDDGRALRVTASLGVATACLGTGPEAFLAAVDRAMYQSKEGGRNRVSVATEAELRPAGET